MPLCPCNTPVPRVPISRQLLWVRPWPLQLLPPLELRSRRRLRRSTAASTLAAVAATAIADPVVTALVVPHAGRAIRVALINASWSASTIACAPFAITAFAQPRTISFRAAVAASTRITAPPPVTACRPVVAPAATPVALPAAAPAIRAAPVAPPGTACPPAVAPPAAVLAPRATLARPAIRLRAAPVHRRVAAVCCRAASYSALATVARPATACRAARVVQAARTAAR